MRYFIPASGPASNHPSIPFFQVQEVVNPDEYQFPVNDDANTVIIHYQKGFVKITEQLADETKSYGIGVSQRWEWEYTQDISEASRFRSTEATRYFQEFCGGPRPGNHISAMAVKHAKTKEFPVFA